MNTNTAAVKVIIVDDAGAVRGMLRALLSAEGYNVVADLGSGAQLLAAVAKHEPAIVCLDYNLPDANGIDLLKAIHAAHPHVAVVMITGSSEPDLESAAATAGAAGFLRKPFSPDRILKELRQVAHTQQLLGATAAAAAKAPPPVVATARARAVIADDSASMRALLSGILERVAVEVVGAACDGKQAVELVAQHHPDIVCLDVDMPVMNGIEALQAIHAAHPAIKVLMITGSTSRDAIVQAGKLGARGYILKPFQPEKVVQAIDKLLTS